MLRYLVLLALAVAVAQAIVCPPHFCDSVDCEDLTHCKQSNGMKVRENGSFCRCCDICVTLIGEGQHCIPEGHFLGVIHTSECATGLFCNPSTKTCEKV